MHGWCGKILHADLTARRFDILEPSPETHAAFPGGRGLGGFLLRPHLHLPWDHPDLPVLLLAGPLTGTRSPCSGRCHLVTLSPLTGTVGDDSLGGRLGWQLKHAGWDGIVFTGRSEAPLGVLVEDGRARFEDASTLAGRGTTEVFKALKGRGSLACVGPAAEHGVLYAGLAVDRQIAGRGGLGLVLAAKGFKYLAVRGTGRVPVADPEGLAAARADILRQISASPVLLGGQGFARLGTAALLDLVDSRSLLPTDNFRHTRFPAALRVNAPALRRRYAPEGRGCAGCPIRCGWLDAHGRPLPGFETLAHFTALIGNADPELAVQAGELCADLGLDPVSAASSLAAWSEITGRALPPRRVLALLRDAASGRGPGRDLGLGAKRLAERLGRPGAALTVKGLELTAYDPRGACGLALAYAVSTRGGCPHRAYPLSHELLRKPVATDRFTFGGKARLVKLAEDQNAAADSLTACRNVFLATGLEEYARAFAAVTGFPATGQDLARMGERVAYQERLMNAALGFHAADDDLPERFFREPGDPGEGFAVPPLNRADFLEARARYYRVRGLDKDGRPVRAKAEELGLAWTVS